MANLVIIEIKANKLFEENGKRLNLLRLMDFNRIGRYYDRDVDKAFYVYAKVDEFEKIREDDIKDLIDADVVKIIKL